MKILFRFIVLGTLILAGGLLYPLTVNILIMTNVFPTDTASTSLGYEMTSKAVFVWIIAVIMGIISVFIDNKWRYLLLICPLIAPSVFALLYSISSH